MYKLDNIKEISDAGFFLFYKKQNNDKMLQNFEKLEKEKMNSIQ